MNRKRTTLTIKIVWTILCFIGQSSFLLAQEKTNTRSKNLYINVGLGVNVIHGDVVGLSGLFSEGHMKRGTKDEIDFTYNLGLSKQLSPGLMANLYLSSGYFSGSVDQFRVNGNEEYIDGNVLIYGFGIQGYLNRIKMPITKTDVLYFLETGFGFSQSKGKHVVNQEMEHFKTKGQLHLRIGFGIEMKLSQQVGLEMGLKKYIHYKDNFDGISQSTRGSKDKLYQMHMGVNINIRSSNRSLKWDTFHRTSKRRKNKRSIQVLKEPIQIDTLLYSTEQELDTIVAVLEGEQVVSQFISDIDSLNQPKDFTSLEGIEYTYNKDRIPMNSFEFVQDIIGDIDGDNACILNAELLGRLPKPEQSFKVICATLFGLEGSRQFVDSSLVDTEFIAPIANETYTMEKDSFLFQPLEWTVLDVEDFSDEEEWIDLKDMDTDTLQISQNELKIDSIRYETYRDTSLSENRSGELGIDEGSGYLDTLGVLNGRINSNIEFGVFKADSISELPTDLSDTSHLNYTKEYSLVTNGVLENSSIAKDSVWPQDLSHLFIQDFILVPKNDARTVEVKNKIKGVTDMLRKEDNALCFIVDKSSTTEGEPSKIVNFIYRMLTIQFAISPSKIYTSYHKDLEKSAGVYLIQVEE